MTSEAWATLITSVVVPLALRILVHYFPWLADASGKTSGQEHAPDDEA